MNARYAIGMLGVAFGTAIAYGAAAQTYSVTDLGTLSTTPTNNGCGSGPTGINDHAQVVGNYFFEPNPAQDYGGWTHGFLWDDGKMTEVAPTFAGGQKLSVAGINNRGTIIANVSRGCLPTGGGDVYFQQLFRLQGAGAVEMSTKMPSQNWLGAAFSGINDNDKIVGTFAERPPTAPVPPTQAFTYSVKNNRLTLLGIPAPYASSYGAAINTFGIVAGTLTDRSTNHAAWWNGRWHVLPCDSCSATGINYWSEIVGFQTSGGFLWNGTMNRLQGFPLAINDKGTIVGRDCQNVNPNNCDAVVWFDSGRSMARLDELVDPHDPAYFVVILIEATAINSHGEIVSQGCYSSGPMRGQCHPFLLTPHQAVAGR